MSGTEGVAQDYREAVAWYRKATDQGNVDAQFNLGVMYANGRGVAQNNKEAVVWYRKAAEQGYASAQNNLGWMYQTGQGVKRDLVLAYLLFNLAATDGDDKAPKNRADVAREMSPRQIEEGQVLTSKWKVGTSLPTTSKTGGEVVKKPLAASETPMATQPRRTGNCRPTTSSIRCQSRCTNGNCIVTYENGCEIRVQVQAKFNPFNSQWEYPSPGC